MKAYKLCQGTKKAINGTTIMNVCTTLRTMLDPFKCLPPTNNKASNMFSSAKNKPYNLVSPLIYCKWYSWRSWAIFLEAKLLHNMSLDNHMLNITLTFENQGETGLSSLDHLESFIYPPRLEILVAFNLPAYPRSSCSSIKYNISSCNYNTKQIYFIYAINVIL